MDMAHRFLAPALGNGGADRATQRFGHRVGVAFTATRQ
jgi:hypothetical protein